MRRSEDDRKVRGERVRSSREEKRERKRASGGTVGRSTDRERTADSRELADWATAFADETFVEAPAVTALEERIQRWLRAGRPVHLIGPTGCGKTALAVHAARTRDRPVVFINGDATMTTADLVGEYAETERESVRDRYVHNVMKSKDVVRDRWVDNPLTVAAREGATLVYNEFSRTKPAANNVLLSVFEEGVLELPGKRGESRYVDVHPEFRAILTSNSVEYAGVHTPQDALLDRLVGIHMDFYDRETERAIVEAQVEGIEEPSLDRVVDLFRSLRESEDVDVTVGTRTMVVAAEGIAAAGGSVDEEAFVDICLDALSSKVPDSEGVLQLRKAIVAASDRLQ